jgi:hypothetical protein
MKALRWLAWLSARRSDGATVRYTHVFLTVDGKLAETAFCGAYRPLDGVVQIVIASEAQNRCYHCDEQLRVRGGPHPAVSSPAALHKFNFTEYAPRYSFEDFARET